MIILSLKLNSYEKLVDFNIGTKINKISKTSNETIYCCSDDGMIRSFTPLKVLNEDVTYCDFQNDILKIIPFLGGFNHMGHRLLNQHHRTYKLTKNGNMIDSRIIEDFLNLTKTLQMKILE